MTRRTGILAAGFAGTVLAANWLTARYGFVPVGFGLTATAGTYAAGLSFGLRDATQESGGAWAAVAAIAVGIALSALVAPPALVFASAAAFALSELADLTVYSPLRRRHWVGAVIASNLVGALVDTYVFLTIAGFPVREAFAGQMVGKALMIVPALFIVRWVRSR